MKAHTKQLSSGAHTRFSLLSKAYLNSPQEKATGVRLAPLNYINNKYIAPPKATVDRTDRQPLVSYNAGPSKIGINPQSLKHNTITTNPKLPLPIEKPKVFPKKGFLDTSLDSALEERDMSLILPQSKLLFKGPTTKPRTNIVLTPISQEKEKSNLIKNSMNNNGYIVKKRMKSVGPRQHDSSFLSEKSKENRQHSDIVPRLNIPHTTSNHKPPVKQQNNILYTDRTHSKKRGSLSPRMSRKGSEPSRFAAHDRLIPKRRFIQDQSHLEEHSASPTHHKKVHKRITTFLAEIDHSLSVESGDDKKQNVTSNMSILEACKPSLDPNKRFNTSFSIDDAYEKLNELTHRNRNARDDLLKIQESVIELQVQEYKRKKNHLSKRSDRDNRSPLPDLEDSPNKMNSNEKYPEN